MEDIKIFEHFDENKNYNMNVFYYIGKGSVENKRIIFVMHGCLRNALNYLKLWVDYADENNLIVICPEFTREKYTISEYDYGGIVEGKEDYSIGDIYTPLAIYDGEIIEESKWIFKNIDDIYLEFIEKNQLRNDGYILYGHSSGSQFVHRFALFSDSPYLKYAVCANAGIYTMLDEDVNYPHGIRNLKKYKNRINSALSRKVYVLVGSLDIDTNMLNTTELELPQGKTRVERAKTFYNKLEEYAKNENIEHKWKFKIMEGVKHSSKETIPFVIDILNKELSH
ncbi:MAG: hypothetical protein FWC68_04245 [Oscillospiraceae bacterium]|nr:hypothetical protein [Oscillospiraceae bacterium]